MTVLADWPTRPVLGPHGAQDPTRPDFDAAGALWGDREPWRAAHDASIQAFEDLRTALRAEPFVARARELAELADLVVSAPGDAHAAVWADPRAYWWTRVAHGLVRTIDAGDELPGLAAAYCAAVGLADPGAALDHHLRGFAVFALGAAVRAGSDCTLTAPLTVTTPFVLPGSDGALDGPPTIELRGVTAGVLDASGGEWRESPAARCGDLVLPLEPATFAVPGFAQGAPALAAGRGFQEEHVQLVGDALAAVARHAPDVFTQMHALFRVAGLKPLEEGGFDDFSEPALPGSFVASVVENPFELGDHLVHELRHHRLSMVEESGPLLVERAGAANYSPWRTIRRGLYGIFHGIFVFTGVYWYWRSVAASDDGSPADREYAADRLRRIPRQLELARAVVGRNADFTALGAALFAELGRRVDAIQEDRRGLDLSDDAPAIEVAPDGSYRPTLGADGRELSAAEAIVEHLEHYDVDRQVHDVLVRPAATLDPIRRS